MSNNNLYSRLFNEIGKTFLVIAEIAFVYAPGGWIIGTEIGEYINKKNNPPKTNWRIEREYIEPKGLPPVPMPFYHALENYQEV